MKALNKTIHEANAQLEDFLAAPVLYNCILYIINSVFRRYLFGFNRMNTEQEPNEYRLIIRPAALLSTTKRFA